MEKIIKVKSDTVMLRHLTALAEESETTVEKVIEIALKSFVISRAMNVEDQLIYLNLLKKTAISNEKNKPSH